LLKIEQTLYFQLHEIIEPAPHRLNCRGQTTNALLAVSILRQQRSIDYKTNQINVLIVSIKRQTGESSAKTRMAWTEEQSVPRQSQKGISSAVIQTGNSLAKTRMTWAEEQSVPRQGQKRRERF
jgi:hypothetical protein